MFTADSSSKDNFFWVLLLVCSFGLFSCGYQFQGSGSDLPADVKKIFIPIAENRSTRPTLSSLVTEAMRDQFERYGVLQVVDSLEEADAVLLVRVLSFDNRTSASTGVADTSLQEQLTIVAEGELRRPTGGALWTNNRLTVSRFIGTDTSSVVTSSSDFASSGLSAAGLAGLQGREVSRGQEEQALQSMSEQLAVIVYDDAVTPEF